jgi:DNA-binding NtrC family response regulator
MNSLQNSKIFVVDDNQSCLFIYSNIIRKLGYENVEVYNNSVDVLGALSKQPKVVFLDYYLDHTTGLELLVKIKRQDPNVFVVLVSGQDDIQIAVKALKYGAIDYLTKEEFSAERIGKLFEKLEELNSIIDAKNRKKKLSTSVAAAVSVAAMLLVKPFTSSNGG